jgi:hypothetical protein
MQKCYITEVTKLKLKQRNLVLINLVSYGQRVHIGEGSDLYEGRGSSYLCCIQI